MCYCTWDQYYWGNFFYVRKKQAKAFNSAVFCKVKFVHILVHVIAQNIVGMYGISLFTTLQMYRSDTRQTIFPNCNWHMKECVFYAQSFVNPYSDMIW